MSTCPDCETGRNLLAGACRSVFQRGLTGGSAGNMSLRVEGGILATPTGIPFGELLDSYFATQKERFLHMENSILLATYEYFFTHRGPEDRALQQSLVSSLHDTIAEILNLGARQGVLADKGLPELTENFLFVFEGMSVLALLGGISEERIDRQLALMRSQLPLK